MRPGHPGDRPDGAHRHETLPRRGENRARHAPGARPVHNGPWLPVRNTPPAPGADASATHTKRKA